MDEPKYKVAVVMPVLNEAAFIGQTLDQLYMQNFPMDQVEVVIADGGSTDGTREIAAGYKDRFGSLKILDNRKKRSSAGRNLGVKNSEAPYVIVLDGHVYLPGKDLLKDMVALFDEYHADCLCRPQPLTPPDISEFQKTVARCRASTLGHNPTSDIYSDYEGETDPTSSGAMYTRALFDRIGYWDEEFDACEDVEFNFRIHKAGEKAVISPKVKIFYYPRASIVGLWKQMVRYGTGRFRLSMKHQQLGIAQGVAAAGIVLLAVLLLFSLVSAGAFSLFRTLLGFYLLMVVGFSAFLAYRDQNFNCLVLGPVIFPTIHFGLGWGFLHGFIEKYIKKQVHKPPPMKLDLF